MNSKKAIYVKNGRRKFICGRPFLVSGVSTCVSLTISLVSMYENVRQKSLDPISQFQCPNCKSKKFNVTDSEHDENGVISKLFLQCEECGEVTQIDFIEK